MSGIEWSDLRVFLAIHRGKSIRAAAKALNFSHSTVSRKLAGMEDNLGAKLFTRSTDGMVATPVAEVIRERAERVESEVSAMEREVLGRDIKLTGAVRITMTPPIAENLIMPHLAEFAEKYPDIDLEIISTYALADMSRHHADIAIRFQEKPDGHLFGRRWPAFGDSIYASPEYIEKHSFTGPNPTGKWLSWGEGNKHPDWIRTMPFPKCLIHHDVPEIHAQIEAAKAGLGMGLLPCFIADPAPDLVRVPGAGVVQTRQGWVLTHPDLKTTERVRICVRFLIDAAAKHQDLITGAEHA
jgi:DNA-binding transcriptional LysR family regulator